jgi:predicted RNA-binding Zn-ribbon protein involved in translation (DUF1610 family)
MDFDPATGKLKCPYCDHVEEIIEEDEEETSAEELDFFEAEQTGNCNWGVEKKTVLCNACGGEMVYDALETAGECPYCGSNQVMEAHTENTLAPGGVCVFKLDATQAASKFKAWIKKRWFCPKEAKETAKPKSLRSLFFCLPYREPHRRIISAKSKDEERKNDKRDAKEKKAYFLEGAFDFAPSDATFCRRGGDLYRIDF